MPWPVPFEFHTLTYEDLVREGAKLPSIPRRSGVFRIFDVHHKLILLERTHNLAARIARFYGFHPDLQGAKALDLSEITGRVEFCRTDSPMEALLLLYLERRRWFPDTYQKMRTLPRYYLLKINRRQRFPRLYSARQIKRGVAYFGPFLGRPELDRFKATLERTFRIRPCEHNIRGGDPYPDCLYFQMRTCSKPCNADIEREAYLQDIDDAIQFVQGLERETVSRTLAKIQELSEETRFEEAERLRTKLERISRARKDHRQAYAYTGSFNLIAVMDSRSLTRKKIALVLEGRIVAVEEHDVDTIEETLQLLIRAQQSASRVTISPEHHYEEFCLVSSFLVKPVSSVRLFPLADPEATAGEIARNLQQEVQARRKPKNSEGNS